MASRHFSPNNRKPLGRPFRDGSLLSRADTDVRADIEKGFLSLETVLPSLTSPGIFLSAAATGLTTGNATLTAEQQFAGVASITPNADPNTLTSRTAALTVADVASKTGRDAIVGDSFDLTLLNLHASNELVVAGGTGVTLVGSNTIAGASSGTFRFRLTNVGSGTEAATLTRIV
jgi:hypothetical protein